MTEPESLQTYGGHPPKWGPLTIKDATMAEDDPIKKNIDGADLVPPIWFDELVEFYKKTSDYNYERQGNKHIFKEK